ncbi:adenylyl-sulfate reductase [Candidatus Pelagibacter sp.]|nr:adenylyl-sulfate reductase [Candidatus Pelagibacter sp.]
MLGTNPFSILAETVSPFAMQSFIIAMIVLIALGTIIQMIHHKNITYFFNNAKKAKLQATREIGAGEKASIIAKTAVVDIGTTSELGFGKRRLSHVLGMYGTIIFWVSSLMLVFCYTGADKSSSSMWSMLWHVGAILTCVGGYWFWLFLRVDVSAEAHPWYRIIKADLFVLALLACATFGLAWSYTQFNGQIIQTGFIKQCLFVRRYQLYRELLQKELKFGHSLFSQQLWLHLFIQSQWVGSGAEAG